MPDQVLAITGSPRRGGNTDVLIEAALEGARAAGAETELLALRDMQIAPCVACNACFKTGACRVQDEYQDVFDKLLSTDLIILGSPVFFMSVSAQTKLMMDRCQCLWAKKYILQEPIIDPPRDRRGIVIAVGGSRGKRMFDGLHWTVKHWFDVLDMRFAAALYVNQVDAKGDAPKHAAAVDQARRLGRTLVEDEGLGSDRTLKVEEFGGLPRSQ